MREIVIVPAWRRPDFFTACLTRLNLSDDGERHYLLALDRAHTPAVAKVASNFKHYLDADRVQVVTRDHTFNDSNNFNTLESYRDAVNSGAELIYLVEEDIFTGVDFFDAHQQAHALVPDAFAVGGCNMFPGKDEHAVHNRHPYHSLGVSWRPEVLTEFVLPHATGLYYGHRQKYCQERFGTTGHWDQDGLIEAVRRMNDKKFTVMDVPRAYHAGYTGYSRLGTHFLDPAETCENHIIEAASKLLLMTTEQLNDRATFDKDHQTVPLDARRGPITRVLGEPADTLRQ